MNVLPIEAVQSVSRVNPTEATQTPASLWQQQNLFEQMMLQNGLSMLDATGGEDKGHEDDEA